MKIAILAAGGSNSFPLIFDKPKCLYHLGGEVQIERVISTAKKFVNDQDIIIIGGYKYNQLSKYIKKNHPLIELRENENYKKSAVFSLRKAIEDIKDDIVIMLADENISEENVGRICRSNRKMAIMCHDTFYYYSVGIMKLRNDALNIINDDCYLSNEYMKSVYCFAHNKNLCDVYFNINTGVSLGYITIDLVRRIGNIKTIEDPMNFYKGNEIDFIHFDPQKEYIPDIDHFYDTDEYKTQPFMRFYSDYISDGIKKGGRLIKKIYKRIYH